MRGNFAAIALTVIGAVALGVNLELYKKEKDALLRKWWPLALIAVGVALFFTPDDSGKKKPGA